MGNYLGFRAGLGSVEERNLMALQGVELQSSNRHSVSLPTELSWRNITFIAIFEVRFTVDLVRRSTPVSEYPTEFLEYLSYGLVSGSK
jgi:hypothetical protein